MRQAIWEHLITKRKYNKLMIKYELAKEDIEHKVVQLNTEKRIHQKQKEIWEKELAEQELQIIELKKKIRKKRS